MIQSNVVITQLNNNVLSILYENNQMKKLSVCNTYQDILSNIYVSKVKNIVRNLNAAFVEIKPGFLCYLSLDSLKNPIITNRKKFDCLKEGDEILVQVIKESLKTKDPVVSSELSLSGTYCAVTYNESGKIYFSKKIRKDIKEQLRNALPSSVEFDVIIRTKAVECVSDELSKISSEILFLTNALKEIIKHCESRTCYSLLYTPSPDYIHFLSNLKEDEYEQITTDLSFVHESIMNYFKDNKSIQRKLSFYNDSFSLNKLYSIETKISELLSKKVWLKSGANIIIEVTEALTVIDVNTGKCMNKRNKENNILEINKEAAKEIARQLILRNLSGIIIIDFINMETLDIKNQLISYLKMCIKNDTVQTDFIDITPLGLVELTRKKVRKTIYEQIS